MDQILQVVGALLILSAYIASLFRMLDSSSWAYLPLEGVWAIVTTGTIVAKLGGRDAAPSPHG